MYFENYYFISKLSIVRTMINEVITRAINSINRLLEPSQPLISDCENSLVNNMVHLLNQLLEPDVARGTWIRLFCRRLNRLMTLNDRDGILSHDAWEELQKDISCVLQGPNGEQHNASRKGFLKKMEFEDKLEQRELHFRQNIREQKHLHQLLNEHPDFFKEYLQKCISLHSKIQVQSLIGNMDDFCKVYGITEASCTWKSGNHLNEKLQCIEIDLDCSKQSLRSIDSGCFTCDDPYKRANNNPGNFIPSQEQIDKKSCEGEMEITDALEKHRWLVILGDPGSAKTTLLRWITRVFAEKADSDCKKNDNIPIRIPILIWIGEFAEWVDQNKTKTLMDYIGEHTWFSERYCPNEYGYMLKDLIYHGHALILLDGLDEIHEIGQRKEIVDRVKIFIEEYVCTPYFISPFDDQNLSEDAVNIQTPCKSVGNQIVITSRIVSYQFSPISGPFINHYLLQLMKHKQAKKFIKKWQEQVEQNILDILVREGININKRTADILRKKRRNTIKAMFQNGSEFLSSNPSLLSLISSIIFHSSDKFDPKCRVDVYNQTVEITLHLWTSKEPIFSKDMLIHFLIGLSTYLHLHSPSGLIDEFDIEHLCCLVLQQQNLSNNRQELRQNANKFISLLKSNGGITIERGLNIFGFQHLSLQEYFVGLSLVKDSSIENIVKRILSFAINPRFHESLLLTIGLISLMRSFDEYDQFSNYSLRKQMIIQFHLEHLYSLMLFMIYKYYLQTKSFLMH